MPSKAATVEQYLAELPADRRAAIETIRKTILRNLPAGYEEGMQYGMIGYYVPHSIYPAGYHCDPKQPVPFAGIGSWKNHIGLYLMCIYGSEEHRQWFTDAWTAAGRKLDMGAGCVRIKSLNDCPLDVLGKAIKRVPVKKFLQHYEANIATSAKAKKPPAKKAPAKRAPVKKAGSTATSRSATKKTPRKKSAARKR